MQSCLITLNILKLFNTVYLFVFKFKLCLLIKILIYSNASKLSQPDAGEVNFHFVTFINANGQLYELGKYF